MSYKYTLKEVLPNILLVEASSQEDISKLFVRFQEYYESPLPTIKGKIFTLGYLKNQYSLNPERSAGSGAFTYIGKHNMFKPDWDGFNIPSTAIEPFIKGLFDPLTEEEAFLVNALKCRTGAFYVIGVYTDNHGDTVLNHEIAHGLFYTNHKYREKVLNLVYSLPKECFSLVKRIGYCDDVLADEVHAWFGVDIDTTLKDYHVSKKNLKHITTIGNKIKKIFFTYKNKLSLT